MKFGDIFRMQCRLLYEESIISVLDHKAQLIHWRESIMAI